MLKIFIRNSVNFQILCKFNLRFINNLYHPINSNVCKTLKERPIRGSENFTAIPRGHSKTEKNQAERKSAATGKGLSRYRESPLRKPPSQPETARYLGMFYTSLGNNVLLPGWIISGMRRPSRQMARTGGNCGLLLALVSPVGCESRNAGDAAPSQWRSDSNPSNSSFRPCIHHPPARLHHPPHRCFRRCVITRVTVMRECESRLSNACRVIPLYSVSALRATQSSLRSAPPRSPSTFNRVRSRWN